MKRQEENAEGPPLQGEPGGALEVPLPTLHHIAITVRDFEISVPWYERVFAITEEMEYSHEGGIGKLLVDETWQLVIVLHVHDATGDELFSERRTGLDHLGMVVPSRADLVAWQERLESLGGVRRTATADRPLTQSPITDASYGSILVFRDPDNIQLELCAPPEDSDGV